jgi:hypothetical protein
MTTAEKIHDFESLVEELTKEDPNENQVKSLMEKLDMEYQTDSVDRIAKVLEKMNQLVFDPVRKKGDYDLR